MTIKGQNFEIYAGDSKNLEILITDSTDSPLDLTPYMIAGGITWVIYHPTTKAIVLSKGYTDGITVPIPSNGIAIVSLLPEDTENIAPKLYNHECEISSSTTEVATVTVGTVNIIYSRA
jgi:hypothetical protein